MAAISRITIDGFKAFPDSFTLDVEGKNLLMYGENGSGKSSIYYALHSLLQSQCGIDKNNIYFDPDHSESIVNQHTRKNNAKVEIKFENCDVTYTISHNGYQESVKQDISPLRDLNGKCVFINHKFLFNVFSFRNSQYIDLFPVFIKDILPFHITQNRAHYISELYDEIMKGIKKKGKSRRIDSDYKALIDNFNNELVHVINGINTDNVKTASKLFNDYFRNEEDPELRIQLSYENNNDSIPQPGVSYWLRIGYRNKQSFIANAPKVERLSYRKELLSPVITLNVEEKQADGTYTAIKKPQTYFNEAKLTAIALAIRFSLLDTLSQEDGRFIALDDMLISLDMSNRAKVVDFLLEISDKYKIYLFTHDKMFFEYFKHKTKKYQDAWVYKEIYMDDDKTPYIRNSEDYLGQAEHYIKRHQYEIAGNFLRKAAELLCKNFLPNKWQLSPDYSRLDLNGLIHNCKKYAEESGMTDTSVFEELDSFRKFILNPASHDSYDVVKYRYEVELCLQTLTVFKDIDSVPFLNRGDKLCFELKCKAPSIDIYKFELILCDSFRIIKQPGKTPLLSKGMINYRVIKNGEVGTMQSDNTTIKSFYDKCYEKSDKSKDADYLNSVVEVESGNPISTFI